MPQPHTTPGVYVEEVTSGTRSLVGTPTGVTAFVGRTRRGPVGQPMPVTSVQAFERLFGGDGDHGPMAHAVADFFRNGGGSAVVLRLFEPSADGAAARACLDANGLRLVAVEPGSWANGLRVRVQAPAAHEAERAARQLGVAPQDVFTLRLRDMDSRAEEVHATVTAVDSARRVDRVLQAQSLLARVDGPLQTPTAHPNAGGNPWLGAAASSGVSTPGHDGQPLALHSFVGDHHAAARTGLYALDQVEAFNLLYLPPYLDAGDASAQDVDADLIAQAARYCEARRAFLLVDAPSHWTDVASALAGLPSLGTRSPNAAVYFPRLRTGPSGAAAAGGAIAGLIVRNDNRFGVWKAPAGLDARLQPSASPLQVLSDAENAQLNPRGVNCLRSFPGVGTVVWGGRTLAGDDALASEWKYINVRRLGLHIEDSLVRGLGWTAFEPQGEPLWEQLRLTAERFLHGLFRQGAFRGQTADQAYFARCSRDMHTAADLQEGRVNLQVGFAPLKPAEFLVLEITLRSA